MLFLCQLILCDFFFFFRLLIWWNWLRTREWENVEKKKRGMGDFPLHSEHLETTFCLWARFCQCKRLPLDFRLHWVQSERQWREKWYTHCCLVIFQILAQILQLPFIFQSSWIAPFIMFRFNSFVQWERQSGVYTLSLTWE